MSDIDFEDDEYYNDVDLEDRVLSIGNLNRTLDFLLHLSPLEYYKLLAEETSAANYIEEMFTEDGYKESENILERINKRIDEVQKNMVRQEVREVVDE